MAHSRCSASVNCFRTCLRSKCSLVNEELGGRASVPAPTRSPPASGRGAGAASRSGVRRGLTLTLPGLNAQSLLVLRVCLPPEPRLPGRAATILRRTRIHITFGPSVRHVYPLRGSLQAGYHHMSLDRRADRVPCSLTFCRPVCLAPETLYMPPCTPRMASVVTLTPLPSPGHLDPSQGPGVEWGGLLVGLG